MVYDQGRNRELSFLVGVISNRREKFKLLSLQRDFPQFSALVGDPDFYLEEKPEENGFSV